MDAKAFTALLVGIITALIALIGYWNTHYLQRRDRRALMYAEAVAAMRTYEQAPYLVRRRADSSGATRAAIAAQLIDANTRVSYNEKLLLMDSMPVGTAFGLLLEVTRAQLSRYRDEAWRTAVMAHDEEVPQSTLQYSYDNEAEWGLCIVAMQRELKLWGWAGRRDTLRECADLVGARARQLKS
jgi:hypothetical protein